MQPEYEKRVEPNVVSGDGLAGGETQDPFLFDTPGRQGGCPSVAALDLNLQQRQDQAYRKKIQRKAGAGQNPRQRCAQHESFIILPELWARFVQGRGRVPSLRGVGGREPLRGGSPSS